MHIWRHRLSASDSLDGVDHAVLSAAQVQLSESSQYAAVQSLVCEMVVADSGIDCRGHVVSRLAANAGRTDLLLPTGGPAAPWSALRGGCEIGV